MCSRPAVEPARREDRPPAPGDEYGQRAALAEPDQRLQVRRQDVERPAAVPQRILGRRQRRQVQTQSTRRSRTARSRGPVRAGGGWRESPERGIAAATVVAALVVDTDERAALRAHGGPRSLSPRHQRIISIANCGLRIADCRLLIGAAWTLVGGQNPFAQPNALRRHFDELVVVDEFDRLLEPQLARRNQTDCFIRR